MVDLQELRFDLGTPWLNLLGTLGRPYSAHPIERLTGPARLAEWLAHEGFTPATGERSTADVALAKQLRETLRPLVLAAARGESPDPAAAGALNDFLAADEPVRVEPDDGGLRAVPASTLPAALSRVARQAALQLSGPEAAQLRLCADEECAGAYLDPTGRRRWCATDRCGVKARVRAHRARLKADGAAADH